MGVAKSKSSTYVMTGVLNPRIVGKTPVAISVGGTFVSNRKLV